jgi:hypothetical protein
MQTSRYYSNHAEHYYDHLLHRLDGPAIHYYDHPEQNQYWIHGVRMSPNEWRFYCFVNGIKTHLL